MSDPRKPCAEHEAAGLPGIDSCLACHALMGPIVRYELRGLATVDVDMSHPMAEAVIAQLKVHGLREVKYE